LLNELGQARIDKVSDHTNTLLFTSIESLLHVARHILLQHGLDITTLLLVRREYCLGTQQTSFFRRIPVEFNSVIGLAFNDLIGLDKDAKSFQDRYSPTSAILSIKDRLKTSPNSPPVIICSGRRKIPREEEVYAVLVGTNNNCFVALTWYPCYNAILTPMNAQTALLLLRAQWRWP